MQNISTTLQASLARETTTLATCWSIARRDGVVLYFTDHDRDITFGGHDYTAASGMSPTAVTSQAGLAVDNLEFEGILSDDRITEADILAGLYDHAEITLFMIDYTVSGTDKLELKTGWLGEVTLQGGQFIAEMRGLTSRLQQVIGEVYTNSCRAQLGDARCGKNLVAYTIMGTVTAAGSSYSFTDSSISQPADYFTYGLVTFSSGLNAGASMEVRDYRNGVFGLFLPMPRPIAVGDAYQVVAGCDKTFATCISKFNNAINFRGEPHVPGTDKLLETSATRSS